MGLIYHFYPCFISLLQNDSRQKYVENKSQPSSHGALRYKQLIGPTMDYACPFWWSVGRYHIRELQVQQSKCLRIATNAPWYNGNRQLRDDLRVPYFSDHIRSLTERFDSKWADVGTAWQTFALTKCRTASPNKGKQDRQLPLFRLPWLRSSLIFSVVRQMPGYNM